MKKFLFIFLVICCTLPVVAQPPARRKASQQKEQSHANNITTRARIDFPTAAPMDENVVWRRDIYREIDLDDDANASLYYPTEPIGNQMNLFTYIFKLFMTGNISVYEYRLDGNEVFNNISKVKPLAFLDNYHIFYEHTDRGVHLDDSDIPSKEVKAYYIKECAYYDQNTATFHTKVVALCPIMEREDDFGEGTTKYPLFWVKYDDLAPFLTKQQIMTSNLNNAATMSLDDYFTLNMYRGKIYKTTNKLGKTLAQYCNTDSVLSKEQKRIEGELEAFENNLWGNQMKRDSLDSISNSKKEPGGKVKKVRNRRTAKKSVRHNRRSSSSRVSTAPARVTVRRERH